MTINIGERTRVTGAAIASQEATAIHQAVRAVLFAALAAGGYRGGLHVELPRQSHRWHDTARESAAFIASQLSVPEVT